MHTSIKSFIRNFKKRKIIYSITIGGFALSMAVLFLIVSFIIDEKSYDKNIPNGGNIYRIKQSKGNISIPKRSLQHIVDAVPEVEAMCLFNTAELIYAYDNEKHKADFLQASPQYFNIFAIKTVQGSIADNFNAKENLVVTEAFAKKVFGNQNPIGKVIEIEGHAAKTVIAVIENVAPNSSIQYDAIVCIQQELFGGSWCQDDECYYLYASALTLNANANVDSVSSKIAQVMNQYPMFDAKYVSLQPYQDIYFDSKSVNDRHKHANVKMIKLLSWIAMVIFILAVLNYINLSTASNIERFKEVCIRKTSGAKNRIIIAQFLGESYFASFIAMVLAFVIIAFMSPLFTAIFGREFDALPMLMQKISLFIVAVVFILIGLLAGLYPALAVARYNPIQLVNNEKANSKMGVRAVFNLFQFVVSIVLITSLIVVNKQLKYVKTKDFGFNTEHLLNVNLEGETEEHPQAIKQKLLKNPNVISATTSDGIPFEVWMVRSGSFSVEGEQVRVDQVYDLPVDYTFLETFKISLIEGRDIRDEDKNVCLINKRYYQELGWKTIENKNIWGKQLIGVIDDIHFEDLKKRIGKIQLCYEGAEKKLAVMSIRIANTNIPETMDYIKTVMREIDPYIHLEYRFYNDKLDELYKEEDKQAKAIRIYCFIAILLSCLGLFGMVEFASKRRMKEIGVRRVNGAKVSDVLMLLNKDFTIWVIMAFVIACPVSYYIMDKWLANFAYKTLLSWWLFLLAGIITLVVALITVSWHSWRTSSENPVKALRYE